MSRSKYKPDDPVTAIPLVGPQYREKLERLGISTVTDLVFHTPFRYDDTRNINSIAELSPLPRPEGRGFGLGRGIFATG